MECESKDPETNYFRNADSGFLARSIERKLSTAM